MLMKFVMVLWARITHFLQNGLLNRELFDIGVIASRDYMKQWAAFTVVMLATAVILFKGFRWVCESDVELATPESATAVFLGSLLVVPAAFGFCFGFLGLSVVSDFTLLLFGLWFVVFLYYSR